MAISFNKETKSEKETTTSTVNAETPVVQPVQNTPSTSPQDNAQKGVSFGVFFATAFCLTILSSLVTSALVKKNDNNKVVESTATATPAILENATKMDTDVGDLVVYKATTPEGNTYYPLATKDGKKVFLGVLLDGDNGAMLVDVDNGLPNTATNANNANIEPQTQVENNQADDTTTVQDGTVMDVTAPPPNEEDVSFTTRRWGGAYTTAGLASFNEPVTYYGKHGLANDFFTKSLLNTGEVAGVKHTGAGVGIFKADMPLPARKIAEMISREAHHTGLSNKDVMANPQNYVWIFHKHDCVYCRNLITGMGDTPSNVVFIPLINSHDDLSSTNTIKALAELDGRYSVLALETMNTQDIKIGNDYTEEDIVNLRYNTDLIGGLYRVMEEFNYPFMKQANGGYIYSTPTTLYFNRETGLPEISLHIANEKERQRILGF